MIRINLIHDVSAIAKPKGKKSRFKINFDLTSRINTQAAALAADETRNLLIRCLVLVFPVVLLIAYDRHVKVVSEENLKKLTAENTALQAKLKGLDAAVLEVEKFQEEKRKLESEIQIIKNLSKERLKNVKAMDALQGIIPTKAWLKDLKIKDKNIEINGFAMDDFVISEFMQGLSSSVYFSNVLLVSSDEERRSDGTVKKFSIKSTMENL